MLSSPSGQSRQWLQDLELILYLASSMSVVHKLSLDETLSLKIFICIFGCVCLRFTSCLGEQPLQLSFYSRRVLPENLSKRKIGSSVSKCNHLVVPRCSFCDRSYSVDFFWVCLVFLFFLFYSETLIVRGDDAWL